MKTEKTIKQLYNDFCDRYSIEDTSKSIELSMLYRYLRYHMSNQNGNHVHITGVVMAGLISKFLGYTPTNVNKEKASLSERIIKIHGMGLHISYYFQSGDDEDRLSPNTQPSVEINRIMLDGVDITNDFDNMMPDMTFQELEEVILNMELEEVVEIV